MKLLFEIQIIYSAMLAAARDIEDRRVLAVLVSIMLYVK